MCPYVLPVYRLHMYQMCGELWSEYGDTMQWMMSSPWWKGCVVCSLWLTEDHSPHRRLTAPLLWSQWARHGAVAELGRTSWVVVQSALWIGKGPSVNLFSLSHGSVDSTPTLLYRFYIVDEELKWQPVNFQMFEQIESCSIRADSPLH